MKLFSKIKNWVRYNPPSALSSRGWRLFNKEFSEKAPIRYYLTHDFKKIFYPILWKITSVQDWIRYRTISRYHVLKTGLEPGYAGVDDQILNVNFNLLVDFVEIEVGYRTYIWSDEVKNVGWIKYIPFYRLFRRNRRYIKYAIKHLEWASTLDDPSLPFHERSDQQAKDSREILRLYRWWKEIRPNRKLEELPEYSNQGLGFMAPLDDDFDRNAEDYKKYHEVVEKNNNLEDEWHKEDEEMLISLMKIRRSLWT